MKNKSKQKFNSQTVIVFSIIGAVFLGFLTWYMFRRYESGILEVYATVQDGYVQLVLEQINLSENKDNEKIVSDILGTLDASNKKYWTFSQEEALLFVKDVAETNKFKNLTTATYYASESSQNFISTLTLNKVSHGTIDVNDRSFIASGVKFVYRGDEYKICLLTDTTVVLENNAYLSAKVSIIIIMGILLISLVMITAILVGVADKNNKAYNDEVDTNTTLRATIEKLNFELLEKNIYNTKYMTFSAKALELFLPKLDRRNVWPVAFHLLRSPLKGVADDFLSDAQVWLDNSTFRFWLYDEYVLLITLKCTGAIDLAVDSSIGDKDIKLLGKMYIEDEPDKSLSELYEEFYKGAIKDGK